MAKDITDIGSLKISIEVDEDSIKEAQKELGKGVNFKQTAKDALTDESALTKAGGRKGFSEQLADLGKILGRLAGIRFGGGVGGTVGAAAGGQAGRALATGLIEKFGIGAIGAAAGVIIIKEFIQALAKSARALLKWSETLADSLRVFSPDIIMADVQRTITGLSTAFAEARGLGATLAETRNNLTQFRANLRLASIGIRFQLSRAMNVVTEDMVKLSKVFRSFMGLFNQAGASTGGRITMATLGLAVPGFTSLTGGGLLGFLGIFSMPLRIWSVIRAWQKQSEGASETMERIREAIERAVEGQDNSTVNNWMLREIEHLIGSNIRFDNRSITPGPAPAPTGSSPPTFTAPPSSNSPF